MRIKLAFLLATLLLGCVSAGAATCPYDQQIVTIAPHQQNGFSWGSVKRPMNDACVSEIGIDPLNDSAWYVGGNSGLYMTKTAGLFWTKPLLGQVRVIYMEPVNELVYVGVGNKLYLSRDQGQNWNAIGTYGAPVESVLVANGKLFVGLAWGTHAVPSGVYVSNLGGGFSTFKPFGAGHTGLIVWSLAYDSLLNVLYAGTEIFDHLPAPYTPKFFRSANDGGFWTNVQGPVNNHVVSMAVRPFDGYLYAMAEAHGVWGTSTNGSTWIPPNNPMGVGSPLLMDPLSTKRLFAGRQRLGLTIGDGGAWMSVDAGKSFTPIGLGGSGVSGLAFNGGRTKLYAVSYASGIYISPMP
jgi:hypothetical protein